MNWSKSSLNSYAVRLTTLLGSASVFTIASALDAHAQGEVVAQTEEIPETVLITGSLIRGTAAVGVPVTNLSPMDFANVGALNTADLFRAFPAANVMPSGVGTNSGATIERGTKVNIRGLDTGTATRSLLMVDGMRFPAQGNGQCVIDPSIIPALSMDHIDVLVDGASATYGSDAVSGVINIILKRNMDGAITQARWTSAAGKNRYLVSGVWGRTWDGGQITLSYEWYNDQPIRGNTHSKYGIDHTPWGFDDRRPLGSSIPPTISTGAPAQPGGGKIGTAASVGHGCTNCYAVPLGTGQNWVPGTGGIGPIGPSSAATLDWLAFNNAGNSGTNGLRNHFDPYDIAWYDANQQRNGGHITVDQQLTSNISFYGSAFYSNRRAGFLNPANLSPAGNNIVAGIGVPTFNPYYPTNAPSNLRISYNNAFESPPITEAYEIAERYQLGLNIALPYSWNGRIWFAETKDSNYNHNIGLVNKAAMSAALGWTIGSTPAAGTTPAIASWTKPANVPYLNLFCDPTAYQCNSDTTTAYFQATRSFDQKMLINEKGMNFDGPLFDLPGGTVKAAIGSSFTSYHFGFLNMSNTNASSLIVPVNYDPESRQVWAVFTQVNIPIFSDQNSIPFFRRLEFEASWRHDQYSDVKGTSNPKVAFNWSPIEDFTVRGTWGNSFRAPVFGEISPLANVAIAGQNLGALAQQPGTIDAGCVAGSSLPPVGSGAWKVLSSFGDGTPGSATACPANNVVLPNGHVLAQPLQPQGISFLGGSAGAEPIRRGGFHGWNGLTPELATNWGLGIDYTPSNNILTGLNLQVTYYVIKINNLLTGFGNPTSNSFNDPSLDFAFLVPTDWLDSGLEGAAACTSNLLPTTCAPFQSAVSGLLAHPRAAVDPQSQTLIMWINDGGTFNKGWLKLDGVDFAGSYDWDWGDIGAFNIGINGTYYVGNRTQSLPGAEIIDSYNTTVNQGQVNEVSGRAELAQNALSRAPWLGEWSVVDHGIHGLLGTLLPQSKRSTQRQRRFLRLKWRSRRPRHGWYLYLRDSETTRISFRPITRSIYPSVTIRWTLRLTSICGISDCSSL